MLDEHKNETEMSSEDQKLLPLGKEAFEIEGPTVLTGWRVTESWITRESKDTWEIAGPAILTSIAQFSIGFITSAYVGHLGEVELAAVSIVQNVIEGFVYGVMLGIGSALETLCGQAVGAGQLNMLGIYLQRSSIITLVTALFLLPAYIFTSPLLNLLRQEKHISEVAGKYAIWSIPQLFAYALNFPMQKFLQAQSKVWVMTIISMVVVGLHVFLNLLLVTWLDHGLLGAAIVGNISWWILVLAHVVYIVSGSFPEAWVGLSLSAFSSLCGFMRLSLASAVMLCLELWYSTLVILMVGWLPNPEVAVDAISICMNVELWTLMISLGFNAAVSVRVSNELGAGNPKAAKLSVAVNVVTSTVFGVIFAVATLVTKYQFPKMFTTDPTVMKETTKLVYFLAAYILINSVQPVLHGVAVGAGWQSTVAWINTICYYIVGLPIGGLLGFKSSLGVQGIWLGVIIGILLQTAVLLFILYRTNWRKEALQAEERVRSWGGSPPGPLVERGQQEYGIRNGELRLS